MIAKGSDCSDYFPAVVKNVVAKNSEVNSECCYFNVFSLSTGEETGIRLSSTLRRRATRYCLTFHQYLPESSQGLFLYSLAHATYNNSNFRILINLFVPVL